MTTHFTDLVTDIDDYKRDQHFFPVFRNEFAMSKRLKTAVLDNFTKTNN